MIGNKDVDEIINGLDDKYVDEACDTEDFYSKRRRNMKIIASVAAAVTVVLLGIGVMKLLQPAKDPGNGETTGTPGVPSAAATQGLAENTRTPSPSPANVTTPIVRPSATPTPEEEQTTMAKTPIVVIRPTKVPTPAPTLVPGAIPEGLTDEHRAKVDPALNKMENSGDPVPAGIFFGNIREEGEKIFREQYPEEYKAYYGYKETGNEPMDVSLIVRGSELHNTLPQKWFEGEVEKFFEKYPELKANIVPSSYSSLTISVPYAKILELAMDPQVRRIYPYDDAASVYYPRVIGEYNGHNVYDIEYYEDNVFFEADVVWRAGDIITHISFPSEMKDDDYLRISFGLYVPSVELNALLQEKAGVMLYSEDYRKWAESEEGGAKLTEIINEYTKTAARKILSFGWPVLRELKGYKNASSKTARYISVLATKKQLMEFIPCLNPTMAGRIGDSVSSYDDTCVTRLFFDGTIRAWLNGCEYGENVDKVKEEPVKIIYSEGHSEHSAVPDVLSPGKVRIMQASLAKALNECDDENVWFPVKIVMQENAYIKSGYLTNIGLVDSPLSDPFVFEGRNYAENVAYYAEEPNLKAFNQDYEKWLEDVYFSKDYEETGQDPLEIFKTRWRQEKGEECWKAYASAAAGLQGFLDAYSDFIATYEETRNGYMIDFGRGRTNKLKDIMSIEYGWGLQGILENGAVILDDISDWYEMSDTCCMLMTKEQIERIYSRSDRCGYLLYWADIELYGDVIP